MTAAMLAVLGGIGRKRERDHLEDLTAREARVASLLVVDTAAPSPSLGPVHAELVIGSVVIGTDYLKQWFSKWRNIFGGEMKAYQKVLSRARREAQLRMTEEAFDLGGRAVVNVRFETSQIAAKAAAPEVLCYGTMVR